MPLFAVLLTFGTNTLWSACEMCSFSFVSGFQCCFILYLKTGLSHLLKGKILFSKASASACLVKVGCLMGWTVTQQNCFYSAIIRKRDYIRTLLQGYPRGWGSILGSSCNILESEWSLGFPVGRRESQQILTESLAGSGHSGCRIVLMKG